MIFKEAKHALELQTSCQKLQDVAEFFANYSEEKFGIKAIVTRVREKIEGSSGVHEQGRAIDFASRGRYSKEQVNEILDAVNTAFQRNDRFKTAIHHSFRGGALHFHLQVPAGPWKKVHS